MYKRQVQVVDARRVGPARVGHDDLHAGFVLLAAGDTAEEDGVRFRSVGADDEEGGGPCLLYTSRCV